MEVNYINYFNEFEREYEVLKNASDDVLTVSLEILHYIEIKRDTQMAKKTCFSIGPRRNLFFQRVETKNGFKTPLL